MMFRSKIEHYIEQEQLPSAPASVIVAVSGGADSVALLHVLVELGYNVCVAHCNFRLRGTESERDELFVRNLANEWNVPIRIQRFQTRQIAQTEGISIEMAARRLRYAWFEQLRQKEGADWIAVAHHLDDSIETLLINLVRGTGIRGLTGIKPRQGRIIRPFLCVFRSEIEQYLTEKRISFLVDSTNLENDYIRNRFRNKVIPMLEEINPAARNSLAKDILHFRAAEKIYDAHIRQLRDQCLSVMDSTVRIDGTRLLAASSCETLLFEWIGEWGFSFSQCTDIIRALRQKQSGRRFYTKSLEQDRSEVTTHMPPSTKQVLQENRSIHLIVDRNFVLIDTAPKDEHVLSSIPDILHGEEAGKFEIEELNSLPNPTERNPKVAYFDRDTLEFPLTLRRWQCGDMFCPFGMNGKKKKVSDMMVDAKRSLFEKEQQLVMLSGDDIIWVVGLRSDERYRVRENTKHILKIFEKKDTSF